MEPHGRERTEQGDRGQTTRRGKAWLLVPAIAWGGIFLSRLVMVELPPGDAGVWGCLVASFALAALAIRKPVKDIVSLAVPIFALIMFLSPEVTHGLFLQVPYAASLSVLALRLEWRFSRPREERAPAEGEYLEGEGFPEDWDREWWEETGRVEESSNTGGSGEGERSEK